LETVADLLRAIARMRCRARSTQSWQSGSPPRGMRAGRHDRGRGWRGRAATVRGRPAARPGSRSRGTTGKSSPIGRAGSRCRSRRPRGPEAPTGERIGTTSAPSGAASSHRTWTSPRVWPCREGPVRQISLRLSSSRVERVNAVLQEALPGLEKDLLEGAIVTAQDVRIRRPRSRVLLSCRLSARATRVGRPPASARVSPTGSWSAAS
jgi:hypothetical protein